MPTRLSCRKDANSSLRHDPSAKDHGGRPIIRLNDAMVACCQASALMAAKAAAGLTGAAEGEPKQCAMAGPPE